MKLTEASVSPAIIDIDIPELESFDFDSYFKAAVASSQTVNVKSIGKFNSDTKNTINVFTKNYQENLTNLS